MGSKIISLADFAMEREDTDQNTVTQNALLLPPPKILSLYYMYSVISKSGDIYEFNSSVELNDIQMSLCESVNKADFMTLFCEKSERLFNESDDLHYKQQWLQINLKTLMELKRNQNSTRDTDLHVLQWRHGCTVERRSDGSVMFLQGTDEYAYDGQTLTFDLSMHWKPLVLDHNVTWDRESVSSLERKCVETLTRFTGLQREGKIIMKSCSKAYFFVKASGSSVKQLLVCLATGFYPKHVQMEIRHDQTPLPDEQLNSDGIRPNADGSFQLMKSLEILPSERSQYQCVVEHQSLTDPLIIRWDEVNVLLPALIGFIVALVVLAIIVLVFYLLRKYIKRRRFCETTVRLRSSSVQRKLRPAAYSQDFIGHVNHGLLQSAGSRPYPDQMVDLRLDMTTISLKCLQRPRRLNSLRYIGSRVILMKPKLLKNIRPERCAGFAAALNYSDDESPTDPIVKEIWTEELHDTQSLCDTEATPAAARGAMGSKIISLPNFAMEREDTGQNTVTQNALLLPPPRRCRSKNISLPNLTQDRKDSDDSS